MNNTHPNEKHATESILYATSRALERGAYYGLRAILVLYLFHTIRLSETEASEIYGLFIGTLVFSQLLGALLGDLVLGNKKALLIGGLLQAAGAFALCIPSMTGVYIGLILTIIGTGLFSPNILSNFGKLYLSKTRVMDAGFSMFYVAITLGAIMGTSLIAYVGELSTYSNGFILAGIMMLGAVAISLFIKEKKSVKTEISETKNTIKITNNNVIAVIGSIVIVAVFWYAYDFSYNGLEYIRTQFPENSLIGNPWVLSYNTIFLLPAGILLTVIWSFFYSRSLLKLAAGFILGALAFGMLLFLPEDKGIGTSLFFLLSMLFLGVAELCISPILYSILTRNSNPKYLAIIISLSFIPSRLSAFLMAALVTENTSGLSSLYYGAIFLGLIGIALFILVHVKKKKTAVTATLDL